MTAKDDKKELAEREAARKKKIAESRDAYEIKKAHDFGRLGRKEKVDKSRLQSRHKKKGVK